METITQIKERTNLKDSEFVIHDITMNDNEPKGGWHCQASSIDAMISRSSKRWNRFWYTQAKYKTHNTMLKFRHWHEEDQNSYDHMRKYYENKGDHELALKMYPDFKVIKHNCVWDFFDAIGYNYKDKSIKHIDSLIHIEKR